MEDKESENLEMIQEELQKKMVEETEHPISTNTKKPQVIYNPEMDEKHPIKFGVIGSEEIPVDPAATELYFGSLRLNKLEGLDKCVGCQSLVCRTNLIKSVEGVENLTKLTEIDMYDNRIEVIENIDHMTDLDIVDFSFNNIKAISGLDKLHKVRKLFLLSNRIQKVVFY